MNNTYQNDGTCYSAGTIEHTFTFMDASKFNTTEEVVQFFRLYDEIPDVVLDVIFKRICDRHNVKDTYTALKTFALRYIQYDMVDQMLLNLIYPSKENCQLTFGLQNMSRYQINRNGGYSTIRVASNKFGRKKTYHYWKSTLKRYYSKLFKIITDDKHLIIDLEILEKED